MMQLNFTSYTFHYAFYNPKLLQVIVFVCFAVKSIPFSVFIKSSAFQYFQGDFIQINSTIHHLDVNFWIK